MTKFFRKFSLFQLSVVLAFSLVFLTATAHAIVLVADAPAQAGGFAAILASLDWTKLIISVLGLCAAPLLGYVTKGVYYAVPHFIEWAKAKTQIAKHQQAEAVKNRAFDLMQTIVLKFFQTEVDTIKTDLAAGKLTPESAKSMLADVKKKALDQWHEESSASQLKQDVVTVLGQDPVSFAETLLEAAVANIKLGTPKAATATVTLAPAAPTPAPAAAQPAPASP